MTVNSLSVENIDTGDSVKLINTQDSQRRIEGETDARALYFSESSRSLLVDLRARESDEITGLASANRLSQMSGYSSDRRTALAEFAVDLQRLVAPKQGTGWTITDTSRSRTVSGYLESAQWTLNEADPYTLQWALRFRVGEGIGSADVQSRRSVSPDSTWTLDGVGLGTMQTIREDVQQEIEVYDLARAGPEEATVRENSGVLREIQLRGRKVNNASALDDLIADSKGNQQTLTYISPFPGESVDVAIDTYRSTRRQVNNTLEYDLTLVEGQT